MDQQGSFNTIRLVAALVVFHSHMFAISGRPEPMVPGGMKLGAVSVGVFFLISGYLVAQSARSRPIAEYAMARLLRLLPGLAICMVVSILVGALVTTLPTHAYVSSAQTWGYLRNIAVFWIEMQARLPGVFTGQPIDHVNGSLWTLRYELLCYIALGLASLFGRRGIVAAITGMTALLIASPFLSQGLTFQLFDTFELRHVLRLGSAFALGVGLSFVGTRGAAVATVGFGALALGSVASSSFEVVLFSLWYGSMAVLLGQAAHLDRHLVGRQDVSYGVYIYAFPFQQTAVAIFGTEMFGVIYTTSLAATLCAAALSWVWIEKPLLTRKEAVLQRVSAFVGMASSVDKRVRVASRHTSGR